MDGRKWGTETRKYEREDLTGGSGRDFPPKAGDSRRTYLWRRRHTLAAERLKKTAIPISDIADMCGYESQQSFSTAFRQAYGMPPGRFRRAGRYYPLAPAADGQTLMALYNCRKAMAREWGEMEIQGSITAQMAAFVRAYHAAHTEDPVFCDHLARSLFSDAEYEFRKQCILAGRDFFAPGIRGSEEEILRYIVNTHIAPATLYRSAYWEASAKVAAATGTVQYGILGAGLDTFAFRNLRFAEKYRIFEVDHPASQEDKRRRIVRAGWRIPSGLSFVGVDFRWDPLPEKMRAAGFDPKAKTFFSWLGVSYYLTGEEIRQFLKEVSSLCADGSSILFDYGDRDFFDSRDERVQKQIALACAGGECMKSCFAPGEMVRLLEEQGFLVYEELTPEEIQYRFIADRDMKAFSNIRYVLAVKKCLTR